MTQIQAARQLKITQGFLSRLIRCQRNADLDLAERLGHLTNTNHKIWMKGRGTPDQRRLAFLRLTQA